MKHTIGNHKHPTPLPIVLAWMTALISLITACNTDDLGISPNESTDWKDLNHVELSCTYWEHLQESQENSYLSMQEFELPLVSLEHPNTAWESMIQDDDALPLEHEVQAPDNLFNEDAQYIFELVNQYRASGYTCGTEYYPPVDPLNWDNELAKAAKKHSQDMADNNYFNHESLDGRTFVDRINAEDYAGSPGGENIAVGYRSAEAVMQGWMESPGHCVNIMRERFDDVGVGFSDEGYYWTQNFGIRY